MSDIKTIYYKTVSQFCEDYSINEDYVISVFKSLQAAPQKPVITGITELTLLTYLQMIDPPDDPDYFDPRELLYIVYNI